MEPSDALWERQRLLELEMIQEGHTKYLRNSERMADRELGGTTRHGLSLIKQLVLPVAEEIDAKREKSRQGGSGRRHSALGLLKDIDSRTLAFIALRCVFNMSMGRANRSSTSLALVIGRMACDEERYKFYTTEAGKLFAHMLRKMRKTTSDPGVIRRAIVGAFETSGYHWPEWTKHERLHVGQFLMGSLLDGTDLFEENKVVIEGKRKTRSVFQMKQELIDILTSAKGRCALMSPLKYPMLVPPADWTSGYGGGYHYPLEPTPIITGRVSKNYLEDFSHNEGTDVVYESLNIVQQVKWSINKPVLEVMDAMWGNSGVLGVAGMPGKELLPLPSFPHDGETNEEARKLFRKEAAAIHRRNFNSNAKRLLINGIIYTAQRFADEEVIWFPWQLDFRGRMYAQPTGLSPQGHDVARGLLRLKREKPIADHTALKWLMIQGANCYGVDKCSMDERLDWVEENQDRILAIAGDPYADLWWTEADKPWQFLAWVFEYAGFHREGWGYMSHITVQQDGSCNGLQHFSAIMRDPKGGASVNLVPSDQPADVYQEVAEQTMELLREEASDNPLARRWLEVGADRKICKRPVMIVPYSGTRQGAQRYIKAHMEEENPEDAWGTEDEKNKASLYLACIMWRAIDIVIVAARESMNFLTKVSSVASKVDLPLQWTTPDGFPVLQTYFSTVEKSVKTRLGDRLVYLSIREIRKDGKLDARGQRNGVAPNFIHSLDAAALRQYVLLAADHGIEDFSLVHDSFGVHAADTQVSSECLRHAFVEIYRDRNVLEEFLESVKEGLPEEYWKLLPKVPERGTLDIEQVRQSEYFFA